MDAAVYVVSLKPPIYFGHIHLCIVVGSELNFNSCEKNICLSASIVGVGSFSD